MKNFDSEWAERKSVDARTFVMCGERFVMKRAVRPEDLAIRDDIDENAPIEETMAALDDLFLSMVEHDDGAVDRYKALRAKPDELGIGDLNEVIDYLIERQTGRPPTSPSASSLGAGRHGTRSTGGSSRRAPARA